MLGMAKMDNAKSAFATGFFSIFKLTLFSIFDLYHYLALCKFTEAILFYCSNKDQAPDKGIEKSSFSVQIYAAHEILFNVWMKTSDNKV